MHFSTILLAALSAATSVSALTFSGGDATWFHVGLGSCGHVNVDTDFIVAIDIATIQSFPGATPNPNNNPMCGRLIRVTTPAGRQVTVTVADTCPECAVGSVDLSPAAFQQLAPLDVGRIHGITWTLL